jgi:integrase
MFERDELLKILDHAGVNLKAMILLGINAGLGNTDVGTLPLKAIDLKSGWLDYPRSKTAILRRVPLWPETVTAINVALATRRQPKDTADKHLLFIGPRGESYEGAHRGYRVSAEMARALKAAKLDRPGLSFYALRHGFQTIAEGAHDLAAVQSIMGHAPAAGDMSAVYRERINDERLKIVVDHVRNWLFGDKQSSPGTAS